MRGGIAYVLGGRCPGGMCPGGKCPGGGGHALGGGGYVLEPFRIC